MGETRNDRAIADFIDAVAQYKGRAHGPSERRRLVADLRAYVEEGGVTTDELLRMAHNARQEAMARVATAKLN